jgi:hypothetical protein
LRAGDPTPSTKEEKVAAPSGVGRSLRPALSAVAGMAIVVSLLSVPASNAAKGVGGGGGGSGGGITFGSPVIVDPVHAYGEPDIKIAPDGTTYTSGPWGTGTQRSIWNRSIDGGATFRAMHDSPISSAAQSDTQIAGPGGGDTELAIDRAGKVYYSDLAALLTLKLATWNNTTRTMQTGVIDNPLQDINGYDRQWFALWDPPSKPSNYTGPLPVNYLTSAEAIGATDCNPPAVGSCASAYYSTDGIHYTDRTLTWPLSNDGPLAIDQQTGTVLEAISVDSTNDVGVAILTRGQDPTDPSLKNATEVKIADLPAETGTDALFPVITMDSARNAYVAWVTRGENGQPSGTQADAWQIFYSYSTAASGWKKWSAPVRLSAAPSNTNVMPWAVAGSSGRLAVVWYGTNDSANDPSTQDVHQSWNVYMAMVSNAASKGASVQQIQVTRHPSHYGTICLEGLGCVTVAGNRNNADFFQVGMDPRTGAVEVVFNDTSNELIQDNLVPPADGTVDHRGAPVVTLIRQNGGVGLLGKSVSGNPTSGTSLTDPAGDALFDPIYGNSNVASLDLRGVSVTSQGQNLVFRIDVNSLKDLGAALSATGATAVDWVVRWVGPAVDSATGVRNPIYFAAVEFAGATPTFFAGLATSIDLCSVSACTPHITDYPAPPNGGTFVTGQAQLALTGPDSWIITVPKSVVGNVGTGSILESLSAFSFARNASASVQIPNADGEAGITPIEVDGACCVDAKP